MARQAPYRIGSVDNALRLLRLFKEKRPVRVSEAASEIGVAPSTAHRLLASLEQHDFVRRDPATRTYLPGPALAELGLATAGVELLALCGPILRRVCTEVGETTHLVVLEGAAILFLDSVETSQGLRVGSRVGVTMPAHSTSAGKAMLAQLPEEQIDALYSEPGALEQMTARTIVDLSQLHDELAAIRQRGYATNFEESEPGVTAVAAALPVTPDRRRAAISVSGPATRMDEQRVKLIAKVVVEATSSVAAAT